MTSNFFPADFPKITVVTACFNAANTIERTLQSILKQSYPNVELIIVDALSTDDTLKIVQKYNNIVSSIICEKDTGVAQAINKGFRRATGEIFCYLNADDCFYTGALYKVAQEFSGCAEFDVLTGSCQRIFADGSSLITRVPDNFEKVMSLRNDIEQPSTFWRASLHHKIGEFDESYSLAFDWEWWNRLRKGGAKFKIVNEILSVYYFSNDNLTSKAGMRVINEMYRVTRAYGPYRGYVADVYRILFKIFDMNGYYDTPFHGLSFWRRRYFGATLSVLYFIFGSKTINAYNWNWASKQIRGVCWYK